MRCITSWRVPSFLVASLISSLLGALGVTWDITKLTYFSAHSAIVTLCILSNSGKQKQLYLSMTTVRYSPQGSGLGKSIVSSFHGMFGSSVILRGSNRSAFLIVAAWYGKQLSPFFTLAIFSTAGNQIICLMRRFSFAIPWYPTCARFTALSLNTFGTTILFPLSSVP